MKRKINTTTINKKLARNEELASGRVSYNRVHKNKKAYDRKRDKKIIQN